MRVVNALPERRVVGLHSPEIKAVAKKLSREGGEVVVPDGVHRICTNGSEVIRAFEAFLKIEKRVAQNTMIRYMKCLKKVVNLAIANGWITVNPFAGIKFSEKKVVKDFLTIEEVNTIRTKEFGIERLDMVRDIKSGFE